MKTDPHIPAAPEASEWDVIVVGTGMGGSTVGYALAQRGLRVLFLEKGLFLQRSANRDDSPLGADEDQRPAARLRRGRWPLPIQGKTSSVDKLEFFAPLGCGSGGSTILYSAQLERFLPSDFTPRANYPNVLDSALPEAWPITYAELLPYYRRAEQLYRVRGTQDPLNPDPDSPLRESPPLSARDQDICDSFEQLGLHPYRAHVGLEYVAGCDGCMAVMCPLNCKSDAGQICLLPALEEFGAKILPECEVVSLEADRSKVTRVQCKRNGEVLFISAKVVVLAAGAWNTPILLLKSKSELWPDGLANSSGMVGRNLMLHSSDLVAVKSRKHRSRIGPGKALSVNDFYFSEGEKLGSLQWVGSNPGPQYVLYYLRNINAKMPFFVGILTRPFLRIAAHIAAYLFRDMAVIGTMVEDLPYSHNRVIFDPKAKNEMRFEYRLADDLHARSRSFRKRLRRKLRPHHRIIFLNARTKLNYGHVCGTCRFGDDPETSVLNKDNRTHDLANLFVVDASFFASSGGTNPSLTVAANSLRVAEAIESACREHTRKTERPS